MGLISGILGGIGQAASGFMSVNAQNDALESNARGYEGQAEQARIRGAFDLDRLRYDHRQIEGKMLQGMGVSGADVHSRSAQILRATQSGMNAQAQQVQKYNTEVEAYGFLLQAARERQQKGNAFAAGLQGAINGFGDLLGNWGNFTAAGGSVGGRASGGSCSTSFCSTASSPSSGYTVATPPSTFGLPPRGRTGSMIGGISGSAFYGMGR
jgi:hypothetical protein